MLRQNFLVVKGDLDSGLKFRKTLVVDPARAQVGDAGHAVGFFDNESKSVVLALLGVFSLIDSDNAEFVQDKNSRDLGGLAAADDGNVDGHLIAAGSVDEL